jgi:predicted acylesterase/phospholipase RssA
LIIPDRSTEAIFMKRHLIVLAVLICSCSSFAYYNESLPKEGFSRNESASFMLRGDHDGALVLLALSGGGSRAAYFSSSVMFRLEKMGILQKVDAISSVSGGSITAAYYCMSGDRGEGGTVPSGREWDEPVVKRELKKNLIGRFAGNLFWPDNIALYWLTCYNRTHIMAQTLADNYFDTLPFGRDLTFRDLNPKRPGLIINSTLSTQNLFGQPFTFTDEDFRGVISSDINAFPLSHGVMASATSSTTRCAITPSPGASASSTCSTEASTTTWDWNRSGASSSPTLQAESAAS